MCFCLLYDYGVYVTIAPVLSIPIPRVVNPSGEVTTIPLPATQASIWQPVTVLVLVAVTQHPSATAPIAEVTVFRPKLSESLAPALAFWPIAIPLN